MLVTCRSKLDDIYYRMHLKTRQRRVFYPGGVGNREIPREIYRTLSRLQSFFPGTCGAAFCVVFGCILLTISASEAAGPAPLLGSELQTRILASTSATPVILQYRKGTTDYSAPLTHLENAIRPFLQRKVKELAARSHFHHIRPFQLQPAIALSVDSQGLQDLLSDPDLTRIESDDSWDLHTEEGLELTGGDTLQNLGFTGEGAAIAIIDTGIDPYHPALGGTQIPNSKIVRGLDTADGDQDPQDCSGHGTAVASIAAGVSYQWSPNSYFAGGMAPNARILAYKAAHDDNCQSLQESAVIFAIEDALLHAHGENYELVAINLSGGSGHYSGTCDDADPAMSATVRLATENGISVVSSAGNNGFNDGLASPACLSNVLSVASVWDSQAGLSGSFFCLDAACSSSCDDAFKKKSEPTCYSNSGPNLDLLAPSEYLLAAQAGGQTTSFGGTSGAAPYVTGAIALLRSTFPTLSPAQLRLRLRASGLPRTNPRSNRSTPLLNVLGALSDRIILSNSLHQEILPEIDGVFEDELMVSEEGEIGELRVLVEIRDTDLSSLRIFLISPDGRSLLLENHPTDQETYLNAYYPVDRQPVEGLELFSGLERQGSWRLAIQREAQSPPAYLESWGLYFSDPIPLTSVDVASARVIPIAARGPGAHGTQWRTEIKVYNPSSYNPVDTQVYFIRQDGLGKSEVLQRSVFLSGQQLMGLDDILQDLFGLDAAGGELILRSSGQQILSSVQITTESATGGSFGQFILPADFSQGRPQYLAYLAGGRDFRTNVGISELSGSMTKVSLAIHDSSSGRQIGEVLSLTLHPYEVRRLDRILDQYGCGSTNAWALVQSDGSVQAWASVVDEITGDATFIRARPATLEKSWLIPVIARGPGRGGSLWKSELRILNPGTEGLRLLMEFRMRDSVDLRNRFIDIPPGSVAILEDPVGEIFGLDSGAGTLRVLDSTTEASSIVLSSRIYNETEYGSFGQSIPVSPYGIRTASNIIGIEATAALHTNLILAEGSGSDISLQFEIRDAQGIRQGTSADIHLGAYASYQINDLAARLTAGDVEDCRLQITPTGGNGSYLAFASLVDELSGDALSLPAIEIPPEN